MFPHRYGLASTLILALAGCSPKQDSSGEQPTKARDGAEAGGDPAAEHDTAGNSASREAAINACAAVATLYPKDRLESMETREAVVAKHWARRDGGRGSMHGPPMLWRRNTDLTFEERDGALELHYQKTYEASDEEPKSETLDLGCQICGEVMVCGQDVWALDTRTNQPPKGGPLDLLDTAAILEFEDHAVYLIRHDHEILLEFGADPRSTESGSLDISIRKLEAGAEVVKRSTTYTSEEMAPTLRYVKVDLPGDVEGIRLEYRDADRGVGGGGYGTDSTFESTLYEMESLQKHPDLMDQPKSLEIDDDAPGFNLPHH